MKDNSAKYNRNYAILLFLVFFLFQYSFSQKNGSATPAINTVVIDAGHGGKDPGCHGHSAHEKNVCLSMALKLGDMIQKKYPEIKVIYTRDKDVFVELDERAKIANRNNADLFICIHANSATEVVYGVETYVLGLHRTEAQQAIAERENSIIYDEDDKGQKYKDVDMSPDAIIARQIQLATFLDQSISFASKLQDQFKKIGRSDRGVKQAGFIVLYKTTMPSVLIETGFLTNANEEKFLADSTSQVKMSTAMFTAFENYKNELEGIVVKTSGESEGTKLIEEEKKEVKEIKKTGTIPEKDKVIFRVQIETSEKKVASTDSKFKGLEVYEYQQDRLFKYTVGKYVNDFKGASNYRTELKAKGFQNAFVVAFLNGERINIEKAIKLAEK